MLDYETHPTGRAPIALCTMTRTIRALEWLSMLRQCKYYNCSRRPPLLTRAFSHGISEPQVPADFILRPHMPYPVPAPVVISTPAAPQVNPQKVYYCKHCHGNSPRRFVLKGVQDHIKAKFVPYSLFSLGFLLMITIAFHARHGNANAVLDTDFGKDNA